MIPRINLPLNAKTPLAMSRVLAFGKVFDGTPNISKLSYFPSLPSSRNPQRVSEVVHESSTRINVIVPGHPDSLPGGGRITPIIYVGGELAELESGESRVINNVACPIPYGRPVGKQALLSPPISPLREIVLFVQGIALYKESEFSCN